MATNAITYQKRFVAFLDVLGFKELVKNSSQANRERIQSYFDAVNDVIAYLIQIPAKQGIGSIVISDSVILTVECPKNNDDAIYNLQQLCIAVGIFQQVMAEQGIWIRGAITCGDSYFSDNPVQIVGPAYVKAYLLEESLSIYPRVILDTAIINELGFDYAQNFIDAINKKGKGGIQAKNWGSTILFDWSVQGSRLLIKQDAPLFIDYLKSLIDQEDVGPIETIVDNVGKDLYASGQFYNKHQWTVNYLHSIYFQEGYPYMSGVTPIAEIPTHQRIIHKLRLM